MRNLADFLVHLFSRDGNMDHVYLTAVHDRCLLCEEPISESHTYLTYRVCPFCRFHYTLSARDRIDLLADKGSFKETHKYLSSVDPCPFLAKALPKAPVRGPEAYRTDRGGSYRALPH